ncbi:unnamed protein product [Mytilus coruscus]|uniref:Uncharacterized protein n=1 Tax=Mytilus coruscus TaxID=42192 RepID=A0A6J8DYP0_MYTCO|nr:unnamed protein product [Mytilus coruscus]
MARLAKEFENYIDRFRDEEDINHHGQKQSVQRSFIHGVTSLVEVIDELENPFLEDSNELLVLDTKDIAPSAVVDTIRRIENVGQDQYEKFIEDRFLNRSVSIFEPIKNNGLPLFRTPPEKTLSITKGKTAVLKSDVSLFSRLYISCQTRGGNLDEFFKYENHIHPPAFSLNRNYCQGIKSDLLTKCLEPLTTLNGDVPNVDTIVIDGAAVVNMLKPGAS